MADYKINISFDDQGAGKKLEDLDKKVQKVAKTHKLDFKLPDFSNLQRDLENVGKAANVAFQVFKQVTPLGRQIGELEENFKTVAAAVGKVGQALSTLPALANPLVGFSRTFDLATSAAQRLVDATARIGFAIFGVTQSLNVLKQAWGGFFNDTIGREIALREQILKTATTLAGTNRVFADGFEIKDPREKLQALERPINESIERIRKKSLEIAGTTSEAVIQTFNLVASQIGSVGGSIKDAEELAVKFAGALGTLGMSDPSYAYQEVGSIFRGDINSDSVLAKTLGITSENIRKAKTEAGGLVDFLNRKLEIFAAGQATAAKGFRGITSNIQEMQEELKRAFGSSFLDPILARISAFYDAISGAGAISQLMKTSQAAGQLVGSTLNTVVGTAAGASVFQGLDSKSVERSAKAVEEAFAKAVVYIQEKLADIGPQIENIVNRITQSVAVLSKAFYELGVAYAQLKIERLEIQLRSFSQLTNVVLGAAKAYGYYLDTLKAIMSTPIGRVLNDLRGYYEALGKVGAWELQKLIISLTAIWKITPQVANAVKTAFATVASWFKTAIDFIAGAITKVSSAVTGNVNKAITSVLATLDRVRVALAKLFGQIELTLNALSQRLATAGGPLGALATPIYRASQAFGAVAVAIENAEKNIQEFGVKARTALGIVDAEAKKAATSVSNLGTTIKEGLINTGKAAGTTILGMVGGFAKAIASMFLWQIAITAAFAALQKISDWWEDFSSKQQYKQAIDSINNGLGEQAKAARDTGKALDSVTEALKRKREEQVKGRLQDNINEYLELQTELRKRARNTARMAGEGKEFREGDAGAVERSMDKARQKNPELVKQINELTRERKQAEAALRKLLGEDDPKKSEVELRAQENRQLITDLAEFEKSTRRTIEDEVYNYRREIQNRELQIWRQQGQIRLAQIDYENRKLLEGTDEDAKASLDALLNWISTKRQGELDIEGKKREAQMAAADMERAIGRFRLQLEQQILALRKQINQYDIDVLDRRLKAEQLIANIRNGAVQWDSPEGVTGNTGLKMGNTGRSRGAHYHVEGAATEAEARAIFARGKDAVVTDRPGTLRPEGHRHAGYDLSGGAIKDLVLASGYTMVDWKPNQGNNGNQVVVRRESDQKLLTLSHLATPDKNWTFAQGRGNTDANLENRQRQAMAFYMSKGLTKTQAAALVGNFMHEAPGLNPSAFNKDSGAIGLAQWRGSRRDAMIASGAKDNFQKQLEFSWKELTTTESGALQKLRSAKTLNEALIGAAAYKRFAGWQKGVDSGGEWGQRSAYTKELINKQFRPGRSVPGGGPGAAGIAAVGGAPTSPDITLNITTAELDAVMSRMKAVNAELLKLDEQSQELANKQAFDAFLKSLDKTTAPLQQVNKELGKAESSLELTRTYADAGLFDPEELKQEITYKENLSELEKRRNTLLEKASQIQNATPAEIAKARAAVEAQYQTDKKNLDDIAKKRRRINEILKDETRIQQLNTDLINLQKQTLGTIYNNRSNAVKALLPENDYRGRRRMDADQSIYQRYLDETSGGVKPLSASGAADLQRFAEAQYANADALAAADKELAGFAKQVERANRAAEIYGGSISQFVDDFVIGGADLKTAMRDLTSSIGQEFTRMLLEYVMTPMRERIMELMKSIFVGNSAEERAREALRASNTGLTTSVDNLKTSNETLNTTMAALPAQIQAAVAAGASAAASGASVAAASSASGDLTWPAIPTEAELDGKVPNGDTQKEQGKLLKDLNKGLAAVTQTVVGVTMAFDGFRRVTEGGGTYETLMGLSSIFMGVGSVLSGIGSLGKGGVSAPTPAAAPAPRAAGGPVFSRTPYLVGEMGPELFVPGGNGSIIPNGTTEALLASRNALGGKSTAAAADVFTANRDALSTTASLTRERSIERYLTSGASSTEIKYSRVGSGDLPFVTETDMLQATRLAAQEGARMGQQRTLAALRNDPSARRAIAI